MNEESRRVDAAVLRVWSGILGGCALLLFLLGGVRENFRPPGAGRPAAEIALPVPLEPEGEYPAPPTTFRWKPGGDGVDLYQVVLHRASFERFWESAPLRGVTELTIPREAYDGIPAGQQLYWRVREVSGGRARATSAYTPFRFRVDSKGYGPGEAPFTYDLVE